MLPELEQIVEAFRERDERYKQLLDILKTVFDNQAKVNEEFKVKVKELEEAMIEHTILGSDDER